ncbi:MAG: PEGA domain-containing protein, partial [Acidobacteria bacterium]
EARAPLAELLPAGPLSLPEPDAWAGFEAPAKAPDAELPIVSLDDWERSPGAVGGDAIPGVESGRLPLDLATLGNSGATRAHPPDEVRGPVPEADNPQSADPDLLRMRWYAPGTRMRSILLAALVVLAVGEGLFIAVRTLISRPAAAPATGIVNLASEPSAADVSVDGKPSGRTPTALELPAGRHVIDLSRGGRRRTVTVDAKAGQTTALVLDLGGGTSSTGQMRVSTTPPGARVLVDGQARGTAPLLVADLAPGQHEILVEGRGRSVRQAVTVEAGVTLALVLPLPNADVPAPGWLAITSPEEVQVFNEGELLGTSRSPRIMLPAGQHELDLVNEDLGVRASQAVVVPVGRTATLEMTLPTARIDVNATPWAEVWVDGTRVGETPLAGVPVRVGRHVVTFRHPQLGERRVECVVSLKRPTRLGVDLRK